MTIARRLYSTIPPPTIRSFVNLPKTHIKVHGPDASKFLNGLITNKVHDQHKLGFYCGFLNAKGRVLADSFIYPNHGNEQEFIIECDPNVGDRLLSSLKKYKLRSQVKLERVNDMKTWSLWDDTELPHQLGSLDKVYNKKIPINALDTRSGTFALRMILPEAQSPVDVLSSAFINNELDESTQDAYKIRRMMLGIPEGPDEFTPEKSLPLEYCMDYMGGVDFEKGCYVGQELTIRSHHHGVVRKRVIPVVLTDSADIETQDLEFNPDADYKDYSGLSITDTSESSSAAQQTAPSPFSPSPFQSSGGGSSKPAARRPTGNLIANVGNVGLALVKFEEFGNPDSRFVLNTDDDREVLIKGFQPFWWPEPELNQETE